MAGEYSQRRQFPRIPSAHAVLVKRLGEEDREGFAKTRTMGLGGCGFHSEEAHGVDALLELLISVRQRVIRAKARVVYENPKPEGGYETGVEFLELSPEDQEVLGALFEG